MANSLVDGKMPFFEINEFPDGRAIAIGDEVIVSSDKEEFHLSGVVALETGLEPITHGYTKTAIVMIQMDLGTELDTE